MPSSRQSIQPSAADLRTDFLAQEGDAGRVAVAPNISGGVSLFVSADMALPTSVPLTAGTARALAAELLRVADYCDDVAAAPAQSFTSAARRVATASSSGAFARPYSVGRVAGVAGGSAYQIPALS